jgi:DNA replication and repair protein RecF
VRLVRFEVRDLRNIQHAEVELAPGLNVFVGRNAQGKTSLLEAVGLLARGRSFRTEATATLIRRGSAALVARGFAAEGPEAERLEIELTPSERRLRVDGKEVAPRAYHGHLDVVVYATDRLRVIRGPMRERRLFLDRGAAALWPSYRRALREYERVLRQRNTAFLAGERALAPWDDRLVASGAALRVKRARYVQRLSGALARGYQARGESYALSLEPGAPAGEEQARSALARELESRAGEERRRRITLSGPHRDQLAILVDGRDAQESASSGQARSVLLALTLAVAEVYREERGRPATLLLDDLDSELDEQRTRDVCRGVAERAQALVTTAHPAWAERLDGLARRFHVVEGRISPE